MPREDDRPPRVAIWCAVSSKPQAGEDKASLPEQERQGRLYARRQSGEVVRVYRVPGHSRDIIFWSDAEAAIPAYRELREDCADRAFDVLWALDPDRLGRDDALIHQVASVVERSGATLHIEAGGYAVGEEQSAARYMFSIQAVRAQEDQAKRIRYHEMGMRARVRRGLFSGQPPMGYVAVRNERGEVTGYDIVPHEAAAVRAITDLYLRGHGINTIALEMKASPHRPRWSSQWRQSTICRMMHNDSYAGFPHHGDARPEERSDKYEPLWSEEEFQAILRERERRYRGRNPPGAMCSGLVFCARCGRRMSISGDRGGRRYFGCRKHRQQKLYGKCFAKNTRIEVVEQAVMRKLASLISPEAIDAALARMQPASEMLAAELAEVEKALADVRQRARRIVLAYEAGTVRLDYLNERDTELAAVEADLLEKRRQLNTTAANLPPVSERREKVIHAREELLAGGEFRPEVETVEARNLLLNAGCRVTISEDGIEVEFGVV